MKMFALIHLRKFAALLPLVALTIVATPAHAQDTNKYKVVINHEEQYSIWLVDQKESDEWKDTGETGSLKECMSYIEEVWTDMRPLSLRKKMEEAVIDDQNP